MASMCWVPASSSEPASSAASGVLTLPMPSATAFTALTRAAGQVMLLQS